MLKKYKNRKEAGQILASYLKIYKNNPDFIILGLPRGGIPVAFEVASALNVGLYPLIVRKLGVPWHEELAMGAIVSGGGIYLNDDLIKQCGVSKSELQLVLEKEQLELAHRETAYVKQIPILKNKIACIIDDGIATGASMLAAVNAVKSMQPKKIIVAVPVAPLGFCEQLKSNAAELICPLQPEDFNAVGIWYEEFPQITDTEVLNALCYRL